MKINKRDNLKIINNVLTDLSVAGINASPGQVELRTDVYREVLKALETAQIEIKALRKSLSDHEDTISSLKRKNAGLKASNTKLKRSRINGD